MLKAGVGAGAPEALFGNTGADGKGSRRQSVPTGGRATLTPGNPVSRMMGQYGKATPAYMPPDTADRPPTHPAMNEVRGQSGGVKAHPREGGIGPGPMGATGSATTYAKDQDQT